MSSVACSAGFASLQSQLFVPLHRATALCCCHYASLHSGFVWPTASILAWTRGGSPSNIAPARMPGVYAQMLCTMQSQLSIHSPSPRGRGQSVEKPLSLSKNGVWGVAPRQVAGTPVPVFTPFPGERGQGG